jgi:hypothetical protein
MQESKIWQCVGHGKIARGFGGAYSYRPVLRSNFSRSAWEKIRDFSLLLNLDPRFHEGLVFSAVRTLHTQRQLSFCCFCRERHTERCGLYNHRVAYLSPTQTFSVSYTHLTSRSFAPCFSTRIANDFSSIGWHMLCSCFSSHVGRRLLRSS